MIGLIGAINLWLSIINEEFCKSAIYQWDQSLSIPTLSAIKSSYWSTSWQGAGGGTIGRIAGSKHPRLIFCNWLPLYLAAESKATNRHLTIACSLSNPTIFALTNNTGSLSHLGTGLPRSSSRPCLPNGLITQLAPEWQLSLHWQFRTLSVNIKWIDN